MTDEPFQIPPEYEPRPEQIPPWAHDTKRFRICFAITLRIAERYDPFFCRQLYDGDINTEDDELADSPYG